MFAFVYASFHLLNFVGYDYGFDLQLIWQDGIATKPFILAGLIAFLILVPLAVTSTRASMRRMGKKWKTLHRIVYAAGVAAVVHFLWLAKAAEDWEPLLYGAILALLLFVRLPPVRSRIIETRRRWFAPKTAAGAGTPAKRGSEGGLPTGSPNVSTGTQQASRDL
jgi:sulfoxide reductase heme-binding subunit YedZ